MIPGMGGFNPRQMQKMMKQMGISQEDLNVKRVIFELDGKKMVFENPTVQAVDMQGMKTYQVVGESREESLVPNEDVKMVAEATDVSEQEAKTELDKVDGDIAQAIENLKKE